MHLEKMLAVLPRQARHSMEVSLRACLVPEVSRQQMAAELGDELAPPSVVAVQGSWRLNDIIRETWCKVSPPAPRAALG